MKKIYLLGALLSSFILQACREGETLHASSSSMHSADGSSASIATSSASSSSEGTIDKATLIDGKSFIENLRILTRLSPINFLASAAKLTDGTTQSALNAFHNQISSQQAKNQIHKQYLAQAGLRSLNAMYEAFDAHLWDAWHEPAPKSVEDVTVAFSSRTVGQGSVFTFAVKQDVNVCPENDISEDCIINVDLSATAESDFSPTTQRINDRRTYAIDVWKLRIAGKLQNRHLSVELHPPVDAAYSASGSGLRVVWDKAVHEGWDTTTDAFVRAPDLSLDIALSFTQLNTPHPLTTQWRITGSADYLRLLILDKRRENHSDTPTLTQGWSLDALPLGEGRIGLDLAVEDSDSNGYALATDLTFNEPLPSESDHRFLMTAATTCASVATDCDTVVDTALAGESESDFLDLTAKFNFVASLAGVDPVSLEASVRRTSAQDLSLDWLRFSSAQNYIEANGLLGWDRRIIGLDAANDDGWRLAVDSDDNEVPTGLLLAPNTATTGTVSGATGGATIITYSDGSKEAL